VQPQERQTAEGSELYVFVMQFKDHILSTFQTASHEANSQLDHISQVFRKVFPFDHGGNVGTTGDTRKMNQKIKYTLNGA
jgi:hypothetical protein